MIEHRSPISGIDATGGRYVATAGYDNQLILWDASAAGRLGLRTLVFTANSAAQMRALLEAGADGILTDDPVLLRSVIDSIHAP